MKLKVFKGAQEAIAAGYVYREQHTGLHIEEAVVVCNGTEEGNATVDLVMVDDAGNKFVTMTTVNLLKMVLVVA